VSPTTARKDPTCVDLCDRYVGRVSWPADLHNAHPDEPSASTYVCADEQHQADAAGWVESVTGHPGVFVPWKRSSAPAVQDKTEAGDA
jgi:hypothetical protein